MPENARYVEVSWRAYGSTDVWVEADEDPEDVFWGLVDNHEISIEESVEIDYISDPGDDLA